jgi:hypothetical protein
MKTFADCPTEDSPLRPILSSTKNVELLFAYCKPLQIISLPQPVVLEIVGALISEKPYVKPKISADTRRPKFGAP